MAVVDNVICKYDGKPMMLLPVKTKIKMDTIHVCPTCDPNVYAYWSKKQDYDGD